MVECNWKTTKINALKNAKQPSDAREVRSYLELKNYLKCFVNEKSSDISNLILHLQQWIFQVRWVMQRSLPEIKKIYESEPSCISNYNEIKSLSIYFDMSPVGISAILPQ